MATLQWGDPVSWGVTHDLNSLVNDDTTDSPEYDNKTNKYLMASIVADIDTQAGARDTISYFIARFLYDIDDSGVYVDLSPDIVVPIRGGVSTGYRIGVTGIPIYPHPFVLQVENQTGQDTTGSLNAIDVQLFKLVTA